MALVPDGALMQRAAAGLASVCAELLSSGPGGPGGVYGARVTVLAGTGDNGGDALYAGALLAARGAAVTAIQAGQKIHPGGAAALRTRGGRVVTVAPPRGPDDTRPDAGARYDAGHDARQAIGRADLIIDGMLGIGGSGGLREPYATLAHLAAGERGATTVAVDLPSGIDADTGAVDGPAVRADVTVTFGAIKPGLLIDPGAGHAGVVELVDIGLGPHLEGGPDVSAPQRADIRALLPRPGAESDKYRRGVLGLLAGSDTFTGAALLSTGGAVHGGAGMVRLVTAPAAAAAVRQVWPEVVITELSGDGRDRSEQKNQFPGDVGRVQAWVAGPGMGTTDTAAARLAAVLATSLPVLVDADGLTLLARHKDLLPRAAPTLLTPHAGELGRLLGKDPADVEARRLEHARLAATEFGACVLLKGSTTVVAPPDGLHPVFVNTTGTPWLATAGSGDVLSGLAGALLAQGLLPRQAGIAAAYLHGLAGRLAAAGPEGEGSGTARRLSVPPTSSERFRQPSARSWPRAYKLAAMDSHAQASINLDVIAANVAAVRERVAPTAVMAVVKAGGYGHGAVPAARAAVRGGADWLGVVHVAEALELRAAGIDSPLLCLMAIASDDHPAAIAAGVDLSAGSAGMVRRLATAAAEVGDPGRPGPGAPEGGHRAEPWRGDRGGLAAGAGRRQRGGSRGPAHRGGAVVALRLRRRAGQYVRRGTARRVRGGARCREEARGHRRGAAHREHGRHARGDGGAVRPGAGRRRDLRPVHPARRATAVAAPGDDAAHAAGARQAGARGERRVLRTPVRHAARDDPRPGAARLRRRGAAGGDGAAAAVRARPAMADRRDGVHGPAGRRLRRRAGGRRR